MRRGPKTARLVSHDRLDHGLSQMELKRLTAVGLPTMFICAVFAWAAKSGILQGPPDLNGIEFFAGCESFSNACRARGMNMSGPQP